MIQGRGTDQIRERNPSFYVTISSGSAIRRQETNHHHHVISRVSRIVSIYWFDCWFDPFVGRHPTPSTIEHASSRFLRSFERNLRDYTIESLFSLLPLYFSFGRTHYWSNDRNIEVGESKLNYHINQVLSSEEDESRRSTIGIKFEGMSRSGREPISIHGTKIALSRDRGRFVERAEVAATLFPREKRPFPSRGIN